jgi:hypothetical protein
MLLKYLGLHLGVSYKAKHIWDGRVIEKIERWLACWKMLYLFMGGRISLIKSTPSNLPTYFMSFFLSLRVLQTVLRSSNMISYQVG